MFGYSTVPAVNIKDKILLWRDPIDAGHAAFRRSRVNLATVERELRSPRRPSCLLLCICPVILIHFLLSKI